MVSAQQQVREQNGQRIVGVVAIGRNEGERLVSCLASVVSQVSQVVYVDSGSTDDSVASARSLGADVVALDMQQPFTAARARNAGFARLLELLPQLEYVQFVDGDCEVVSSWLPVAVEFLEQHDDIAVVCGRRRERYPDASVYNRLCDQEWNTPVGEASACGGDALMRVTALSAVQGYDPRLIAGEEPELCVRLRQKGWRIWRLDAEMTWHDAAIMHFSQWWRRTRRAGYAYALGASLHGAPPERHWVRECRRIWLWGLVLPVMLLLITLRFRWGLLMWSIYPLQIFRISRRQGWVFAYYCVLGKFPELQGQLDFWRDHLTGKRRGLIEYKQQG